MGKDWKLQKTQRELKVAGSAVLEAQQAALSSSKSVSRRWIGCVVSSWKA